MKRVLAFFTLLSVTLLFTSCIKDCSADRLLCDFASVYGINGTVYSFFPTDTDSSVLSTSLFDKIFPNADVYPEDASVLLNYRADYGAECGVILCRSDTDRGPLTEMCKRRMELIDPDRDSHLLIRCGRIIFYSTLSDTERANEIITKLLKSL